MEKKKTEKKSKNLFRSFLFKVGKRILPQSIIEIIKVIEREKIFILKMFCVRPMMDEYTEEYVRELRERKRKEFLDALARIDDKHDA